MIDSIMAIKEQVGPTLFLVELFKPLEGLGDLLPSECNALSADRLRISPQEL